MKTDKSIDVGDPIDLYIHRAMTHWAAMQRPKPYSRAHLLRLAACPRQYSPLPQAGIRSYLDFLSPMDAPIDRAVEFYDLSWLVSAQFSLARLGKVT